ncbi:unnamed protein product, partial [Onchocerca flexuosa]|uniref:Presenilin n=1 Tax=Onchocerca flexuosa TaxID=387005 RepID=A0A183HF89_9BILA
NKNFRDLFKAFGFQTAPPILTTLIVITYGTVGILVFFTKITPLYMHQFYVICNCSLVSVFYLRMFPTHTTWFVLVCIIIWDAFAVLAPVGPLRRINEKAHEYSDQVLRFLMFTAEDRYDAPQDETVVDIYAAEPKQNKLSENHETNSIMKLDLYTFQKSYVSSRKSLFQYDFDASFFFKSQETEDEYIRRRKTLHSKNDTQAEIGRICVKFEACNEKKYDEIKLTVYDALNDGSSVRLGMGDFVFYSLLVGKAAATHSAMCVVGSVIGILVGLVITLTILSGEDETAPALPVSITIALVLHFGIYLFVEPFYRQIIITPK